MRLAEARTQTFHDATILVVSTPTLSGRSVIQREFLASDQRYYMVPCPECDHRQRLTWEGLDWREGPEGEPLDVRYRCEGCGSLLEDRQKRVMLERGEWVATQPSRGIAGFHVSALYSPWRTWTQVVESYVENRDKPETRKPWVNTVLGECYEEHEERIEAHEIEDRAEVYPIGTAPTPCLVLTAAVDVQDNRLEVLVKGWSHEGESWAVDLHMLTGDPRRGQVWRDLDRLLARPVPKEDGRELRILSTAIDSGFLADKVYDFCAGKSSRRIVAVKGVAGEGRPILGRPSRKGRGDRATLIPVGVWTGKDVFYGRLSVRRHGPGFQHYPQGGLFDREFFEQLTSETKEVVFERGRKTTKWVKLRRRNEALDLEIYSLAAYALLNPDLAAIEANQAAPAEAEPAKPRGRKRPRWSVT